jgi:hypothetical protein
VAFPRTHASVRAASQLTQTVFRDVDWHEGDAAPPAPAEPAEAAALSARRRGLFYVLVQSKRKASALSAPLSEEDVWVEYGKAREFARHIAFVLVIVTDKDAPPVPVELRHCVVVVGDGEMERFFGPIVAARRRQSR